MPAPRRPLPPLNSADLERYALRYVERYATTRAKLAAYLSRKLRERGWAGEKSPDPGALAERMAGLGYVDDRLYAESKAGAMARRGLGARRVREALRFAGVEEEDAAALAPALAAGLVEPDVVAVAASGTSGAGKSAKPHLLGSEVMGSMSAYAVGGGHRHSPEMVQNLSLAAGEPVTVSFTPLLAPMPRGILATVSAPVHAGVDLAQVRDAYEAAYGAETFVRLLPEGQWPSTAMTLGANTVLLQVALDAAAGRVVAVAAEDNLTKGTAGAAVQCFNLAVGLPETLGLPTAGVAP